MRKILIISFLVMIASSGFSQNYMDIIVKKSCECLDNVPDTLETEQFNMKLGICMIEASAPYKAEIKKDLDIDMDKLDTEGERLGTVIGMKMASVCPNTLLKMSLKGKNKAAPAKEVQIITGKVTRIDKDFFVVFSLKDDLGKITKFYWLTFVESPVDLANSYPTLIGKSVNIEFESQEFFDPRLLEYRKFLIIKSLTLAK